VADKAGRGVLHNFSTRYEQLDEAQGSGRHTSDSNQPLYQLS